MASVGFIVKRSSPTTGKKKPQKKGADIIGAFLRNDNRSFIAFRPKFDLCQLDDLASRRRT